MLRSFLLLLIAFTAIGCKIDDSSGKPDNSNATASSPDEMAEQADIPVYPGASLPDNQSNVRTDGSQTRIELIMVTKDSPEQVAKFYTEKLKLDRSKEGETIRMMGLTPKGNYAIVTAAKEPERTKVIAVSVGTSKPKDAP